MTNINGKSYCLTTLCPINNEIVKGRSCAALTRDIIQRLPTGENSPLALVPQTYFGRFYLLNDVFFEGGYFKKDHLKSQYLVFTVNFHGALDDYLEGFWRCAKHDINKIWQHCVGFDKVNSTKTFIPYIKQCQVTVDLFFNGSTDDPLDEQLKALYLKQELSRFAIEHQGLKADALQDAFKAFLARVEPANLEGPSFLPGVKNV